MPNLTITSQNVTRNGLAGIAESLRVYSASLDGHLLREQWTVPASADDAEERAAFLAHLMEQGYVFTL